MSQAKKVLFISCISFSLFAQENSGLTIYTSSSVDKSLKVVHEGTDFYVIDKKNESKKIIPNWLIDKELRNISREKLLLLSSHCYGQLSQTSNGDYSLKANFRLKGGGPILGGIFYWGVKAVGYGVPIVAATQLAIASVPVTLVGAKAVVAVESVSYGSGLMVSAVTEGGIALGGVSQVGGAVVVNAVGGPAVAAQGVGFLHGATVMTGGYIKAVESLASFVGFVGSCIPWF